MSYLIAALFATVLLLIVAIQNPGLTEVRFLFWQGSMPLALLLLVATVCGGALTAAGGLPYWLREKKQLRALTAEQRAAAAERSRPEPPADQAPPAHAGNAAAEMSVPGLAEAAKGLQEPRQ